MSSVRFWLLMAMVAIGSTTACAPDGVTGSGPAAPPTQGSGPPPSPPPPAPPLSYARAYAVVYNRASPSNFAGDSRFVLLPNGLFRLEYRTFAYPGRYSRVDTIVEFEFDDWGSDGRASGRFRDDQLAVAFNWFMALSDFEGGNYERSSQSEERVYVVNADGSDTATPLALGSWPSWSPDGRRVAFHRDGQVCVVEVDGSHEACLASGSFPSWSPDGQRIVFADAGGISVMRTDGSAISTLLRHHFRSDNVARWDDGLGKPVWSPDGRSIAFELFGDGLAQPPQVFVMNADGSHPHRLTSVDSAGLSAESDPAWSNDGESVVLWSAVHGIARVTAAGGVPSTILEDASAIAYGSRPAPSPDGAAVAYTVTDSTASGASIWITGRGALVANGRDPAWSPDGKRIAFVRRGR